MTTTRTPTRKSRRQHHVAHIRKRDAEYRRYERKGAAAFARLGAALNQAKAELAHGEFILMLKDELQNIRYAQMAMAVSRNPQLVKALNSTLLPLSGSAAYQLSRLSGAPLAEALETLKSGGSITAEQVKRQYVSAKVEHFDTKIFVPVPQPTPVPQPKPVPIPQSTEVPPAEVGWPYHHPKEHGSPPPRPPSRDDQAATLRAIERQEQGCEQLAKLAEIAELATARAAFLDQIHAAFQQLRAALPAPEPLEPSGAKVVPLHPLD